MKDMIFDSTPAVPVLRLGPPGKLIRALLVRHGLVNPPLRRSPCGVQDERATGLPDEIKIMADRLNGYRILILETREEAQFSRLLTEQGADVLQCPMFAIHDAKDRAPVEAWIRRFIAEPCDDL